ETNFTGRSEAMQVTRRIFREARRRAQAKGKKMLLAVLPDPILLGQLRSHTVPERVDAWNDRLAQLHQDGMETADLLPRLLAATDNDLDRGYDGTHSGPKAKPLTAVLMSEHLCTL